MIILPIGDAPNPQGYRPWLTWLLIAVNVVVYVVLTLPQSLQTLPITDPMASEYYEFVKAIPGIGPVEGLQVTQWDLFVFEHGFRPLEGSVLDLFTSMFMHAGFAHLAGNMLYLWIYGDNVEHRLGRPLFLLTYLGTGIIATVAFATYAGWDSPTPLVGASGAISGVLGFYALAFPRNVVRMFVLLLPFFVNTIVLPSWVVLGIYLVLDNLLPLLFSGAASGVAYGAHIGGFVAGALVAWAMQAKGVSMPRREAGQVIELDRKRKDAVDASIAEADTLIQQGRARTGLTLLIRRHNQARQGERGRLALAIGRRLLRMGRMTEGYQWLVDALGDPVSRDAAATELRELELPPQLLARLGLS